ncbi:MAG: hypothetical protein GTO18_19425 [Anaerolineales bacterium]|nr:hypothetical protein [Anaerolineales bacterium]
MNQVNLKHPDFADLAVEVLHRGDMLRFKAHGASMAPFIKDGDILSILPVEESELQIGNVVLYQSESGSLLAHRIVKRSRNEGQWILTVQGDARFALVEEVYPDQVLGRVVCVQRGMNIHHLNRWPWQLVSLLWVEFTLLFNFLRRALGRIKRAVLQLARM